MIHFKLVFLSTLFLPILSQNICTCENGQAATGGTCTQNGFEMCASCDANFDLLVAEKYCEGNQWETNGLSGTGFWVGSGTTMQLGHQHGGRDVNGGRTATRLLTNWAYAPAFVNQYVGWQLNANYANRKFIVRFRVLTYWSYTYYNNGYLVNHDPLNGGTTTHFGMRFFGRYTDVIDGHSYQDWTGDLVLGQWTDHKITGTTPTQADGFIDSYRIILIFEDGYFDMHFDDFRISFLNDCTCSANGSPAPPETCITHNSEQCESCNPGYKLDQNNACIPGLC